MLGLWDWEYFGTVKYNLYTCSCKSCTWKDCTSTIKQCWGNYTFHDQIVSATVEMLRMKRNHQDGVKEAIVESQKELGELYKEHFGTNSEMM